MLKVTCALIIANNKILITQNGNGSDHPFQWEFPGGKIKTGEPDDVCIIREIKEELELDINIVKPLIPVKHDYRIKQIKLIPFICTISAGIIKLNNHVEKKWIVFEELTSVNFSEADKKLISAEQNIKILEEYLGK